MQFCVARQKNNIHSLIIHDLTGHILLSITLLVVLTSYKVFSVGLLEVCG